MTDQLRQQLNDADDSTRAFAATDAGLDCGAEAIEPLLERLLIEPSRFVREAIVTALGQMPEPPVCARVAAVLDSPDAFVRNAAVGILQSKADAALDALEPVLESENADVRKLGLDVLSVNGSARAAALIARRLHDPDVNVRIAAVEYIGDRGDVSLVPELESAWIREQEPMLLATLLGVLVDLGSPASWALIQQRLPTFDRVPDHLASSWLRALAKWGPADASGCALRALSRLGTAALGDVADCIESFHRRHPITLTAKDADAVRGALDVAGQGAAKLRLLAWVGSLPPEPHLLELLRWALAHTDPSVRKGAALGLGLAAPANGVHEV